MRPHKISIKRKKSFNLNYQKNKFVLFVSEGRRLDSGLPLDSNIADMIKKFIDKKVFKNLSFNNSISLDNPLTLEPDSILIIKVKNMLDDKDLYEFQFFQTCKYLQEILRRIVNAYSALDHYKCDKLLIRLCHDILSKKSAFLSYLLKNWPIW